VLKQIIGDFSSMVKISVKIYHSMTRKRLMSFCGTSCGKQQISCFE